MLVLVVLVTVLQGVRGKTFYNPFYETCDSCFLFANHITTVAWALDDKTYANRDYYDRQQISYWFPDDVDSSSFWDNVNQGVHVPDSPQDLFDNQTHCSNNIPRVVRLFHQKRLYDNTQRELEEIFYNHMSFQPSQAEWDEYCAREYPSFNPGATNYFPEHPITDIFTYPEGAVPHFVRNLYYYKQTGCQLFRNLKSTRVRCTPLQDLYYDQLPSYSYCNVDLNLVSHQFGCDAALSTCNSLETESSSVISPTRDVADTPKPRESYPETGRSYSFYQDEDPQFVCWEASTDIQCCPASQLIFSPLSLLLTLLCMALFRAI